MTTTISYVNERIVRVECPGVHSDFVCVREDVNRRHEGTWNSRVFAFVPNTSGIALMPDSSYSYEHFSDGTPVAAYEGMM